MIMIDEAHDLMDWAEEDGQMEVENDSDEDTTESENDDDPSVSQE